MKLLKILALLAALALSGCNNNKNNHLNKATSLDVNNSHIELEFSNIKYKLKTMFNINMLHFGVHTTFLNKAVSIKIL